MFGATLILVIVVTGGIIAFFGDRIGTRVGKKRLSLWGLRPRYTSIIITIITGALIAGSTIGVLTLLSYDVRTALFGMEALKNQTRDLTRQVEARAAALEAAQNELKKKNAEYAEANARTASITKELRQLQADRQSLEERIASLNSAKAELQQDVDQLNELTANLRQGIVTVREGTIVLRAGEVIGLEAIQGGGSTADNEQRLKTYLAMANQRLRERFRIENERQDLIFIARAHAEEVIAFLSSHPEPIVLRLQSVGNVVVGEPVVGQFEVFPNRKVFARGAVVLSDQVSFSGESLDAEPLLTAFLRRVNETAVQQGVIPDPLQGTVGTLPIERYYEAVNQIRRWKGPLELQAVARTDIFSIGPLAIDIVVRPLP